MLASMIASMLAARPPAPYIGCANDAPLAHRIRPHAHPRPSR